MRFGSAFLGTIPVILAKASPQSCRNAAAVHIFGSEKARLLPFTVGLAWIGGVGQP